MITDKDLICSQDQAITADAVSEHSVDLGASGRDIGPGAMIEPFILVTAAFATTVSIAFSLISSSAADLATTPTKHSTVTVLVADLTLGATVKLPPVPAGVTKRYIGFDYDVSTSATAGTVTAGFTIQGAKPSNAVSVTY
jgi:hypothetical protein